MVVPGTLPLAIIRGIAFEPKILQCRDEKVNIVSAAAGIAGQYVPSGTFQGNDLFVLAAAQSTFLYYNPTFANYIIAQTLSTDAVPDYLIPEEALTEPSGVYSGFGTYAGETATATDNPADLTGHAAEARVRRSEHPNAEVLLDLAATITNFVAGEITLPGISKDDTVQIPFLGNYKWDLVLRLIATGERFSPIVKGPFLISDNITQIATP